MKMNLFEKLTVAFSGFSTTVVSMLVGAGLIKYLVGVDKYLINSTTESLPFFFIVLCASLLISLVAFFAVAEENWDGVDILKLVSGIPFFATLVNSIVMSIFSDSYFTGLTFYLKMSALNLGIVALGLLSLSSLVFSFTSKNMYLACKAKVINFFEIRKAQKEEFKNQLKKIEDEAIKPIVKEYNLNVFDEQKALPHSMIEKMDELKVMVDYLKQSIDEVKIQSEIQLLIDNTLPKIITLYQKAKTDNDKKSVENALTNVVNYFAHFQEEMKSKEEYKNNLDMETEISYLNNKYLKQRN